MNKAEKKIREILQCVLARKVRSWPLFKLGEKEYLAANVDRMPTHPDGLRFIGDGFDVLLPAKSSSEFEKLLRIKWAVVIEKKGEGQD